MILSFKNKLKFNNQDKKNKNKDDAQEKGFWKKCFNNKDDP